MEQLAILARKPIDYVKTVFRRKWFLIVPMFIGIIGGIIACNTLPKAYEASTLMLVEEGRVINPLIQGLAISTSTAQRLGVLREQLLGWDRLNQLIKTLDLAKNVKSQLEFESLIKRLRSSIKVRLRSDNIVSISYQGAEPAQTQKIVQTITDIFIAENLRQQSKETEDAVSFINDQVKLYQKKLKETEVSAMDEQLNKLLVDSTPKHPLVIELKKKIQAARNDIEKGNFSIDAQALAGGSNSELQVLKSELKEMRDELGKTPLDSSDSGANRTRVAQSTNEKLYKLLLLERMDKVASRDEGVNQKLYNELLSRLETAKLTQRLESSKEGTRYTVLDPARLPLKPARPNKPLVLFTGLFFGFCIGLGLIFMVELFDHSFLGVDEAKGFLDLPIFGAISKIITENDVKLQKLRNMRVTAISVATGIVLLIVVIFNVFVGN